MRFALKAIIGVFVAALGAGPAAAQAFPDKLVRLVIPFPPGGSSEVQARILAQALSEDWKQPVVIEYKPGAGTTVGAAYIAKSPPDGYTLYQVATSHTISASLYRNLPYDAVTSFAPISLLSVSPLILSVHPRVKAATMKELVDLARAKPGTLNYATSGSGTSPHLAAELFRMGAEVDIVHVPFKGNGPALTALLGGQVDFQFTDVASISHLQSGKLRALAVTTTRRSSQLPDVPTVAESGIPGYETSNWFALLAPAGTPREVVSRIHASVVAALKQPAVRERYLAQGIEPIGSSPEELGAFLRNEVAKYARVIASAGIKVD